MRFGTWNGDLRLASTIRTLVAAGLKIACERNITDERPFESLLGHRHEVSAAVRFIVAIMQSVFRSAARRRNRQARENSERRGGELKTGWTKPPHDTSCYGF